MIYRMVGSVAEFGEDYRALNEITMDSVTMSAAGRVSFGTTNRSYRKAGFPTGPGHVNGFSN